MNKLHQKNIKETSDSGRTMVEMLGVLAIIGLLSVGGVTGYGRAINAYRANGVVDAAQKAAIRTASDIHMSGMPVSPGVADAIKTPGTGYVVQPANATGATDTNINNNDKYFGLVVGDAVQTNDGTTGAPLPKEVARNLLEKAIGEWRSVHGVGVKVGGATTWVTSTDQFDNLVDDATNVIIIFVYASDLSLRSGDGLFSDLPEGAIGGGDNGEGGEENPTCDQECNACSTCEDGQCVADSNKDTDPCTTELGEEGTCNAGTCEPTQTDNCPEGTDVSYEGGHATTLTDGTRCYCDTGTVWDTENKTCVEKPNDCKSYKDCDKGEFCYDGKCAEAILTPVSSLDANYYTYRYSMHWDSAMDFCAATAGDPIASNTCAKVSDGYTYPSISNAGTNNVEMEYGTCPDWQNSSVFPFWTSDTIENYSENHKGGYFIVMGPGLLGVTEDLAGQNALCKH